MKYNIRELLGRTHGADNIFIIECSTGDRGGGNKLSWNRYDDVDYATHEEAEAVIEELKAKD